MFYRYNQFLKAHPYKTNMFTTGIFFGTGDLIAQTLYPHHIDDDKDKPTIYNPYRTLRAWVYGTLVFGPISTKWQAKTLPFIMNPFLSAASRALMPKLRLKRLDNVFRLAVDALIMPGLVWIPLYNTCMSLLAGHPDFIEIATEKLHNNWWRVLRANWLMWVPLQLVNIFYVPVIYRVLVANFWSIGWTCFLSFVHNTKGHGKGTGHKIEEILDIESADEEQTMVYA